MNLRAFFCGGGVFGFHFLWLSFATAVDISHVPRTGTAFFRGAKAIEKMRSEGWTLQSLLQLHKFIAEDELWACSSKYDDSNGQSIPQIHNLHTLAFSAFRSLPFSLRKQYAEVVNPEGNALFSTVIEEQDFEGLAYVARAYRGLEPGKGALEILLREALALRRAAAAALFAKAMLEDWEHEFQQCHENHVVLPLLRFAFLQRNLDDLAKTVESLMRRCKTRDPFRDSGRANHWKNPPLRLHFEIANNIQNPDSSTFPWEERALAMQLLKDSSFDPQLFKALELAPDAFIVSLCPGVSTSHSNKSYLWIRTLVEWMDEQASNGGLVAEPVEVYLDDLDRYSFRFGLKDLGKNAVEAILFDDTSYREYGFDVLRGLLVSQIEDIEIIKLFERLLDERSSIQNLFLRSLVGGDPPPGHKPSFNFEVKHIPAQRTRVIAWLQKRASELASHPDPDKRRLAIVLSSKVRGTLPRNTLLTDGLLSYSRATRSAAAEILFRTHRESFSEIIAERAMKWVAPSDGSLFDYSAILAQKEGCETLANTLKPYLERVIREHVGDEAQVKDYLTIAQCVGEEFFDSMILRLLSQPRSSLPSVIFYLIQFPRGQRLLQLHYERELVNDGDLAYLYYVRSRGKFPPWVSCEMITNYLRNVLSGYGVPDTGYLFGSSLDRCSQEKLEELGVLVEKDDFPSWGKPIVLLGLSRYFPNSELLPKLLAHYDSSAPELICELKQILERSGTNTIGAPLLRWYGKHLSQEYSTTSNYENGGKLLHTLLNQRERESLLLTWKPTDRTAPFEYLFFSAGSRPSFNDHFDRFWDALIAEARNSDRKDFIALSLTRLRGHFTRAPRWLEENYYNLVFHNDPEVSAAAISLAHLVTNQQLFGWIHSKLADGDLQVRQAAVGQMHLFGAKGAEVLRSAVRDNNLRKASLLSLLQMGGVETDQAFQILVSDLTSHLLADRRHAALVLAESPKSIERFLRELIDSEVSLATKLRSSVELQVTLSEKEMALNRSEMQLVARMIESFLEENDFNLSADQFALVESSLTFCQGLEADLPDTASPRFRRVITELITRLKRPRF